MEDIKSTATPVRVPAKPSGPVKVRAWLLAERLDPRPLEAKGALDTAPLVLRLPDDGFAVVFRYGALVLFNASEAVEREFLDRVAPLLTEPLAAREKDEAWLRIDPAAEEQVDATGAIVIREMNIERLQAIAIVLAKSLILSHYELRLAAVFDRIDPMAADLATRARNRGRGRELMRHIGKVLLIQHKMVGRVEIGDKPELLWEHPELERLYARLADEYELRDRDHALDRKLDIISGTVQTLLGLVQSESNLRVEWYIVVLIVAELFLVIYPPVLWGHIWHWFQ
jgi:required for meiotic nuclear division protein 1